MRILPIALLFVTMFGCNSRTPEALAVKKHMTSDQLALGDPIVNSVGMLLVPIPAGKFIMGSQQGKRVQDDEKPQHPVMITKPFFLSVYEITQQQFEKVMKVRPWQNKQLVKEGPDYPATYVGWKDAVQFCQRLSKQEGVKYRLPSEAEWEYACRSGTTTTYSFGADESQLGQHAWYHTNAYLVGEQHAHRVGQKSPNSWALYDMHGNVWEWCHDWYARYGAKKAVSDPLGPAQGQRHVWRGGAFGDASLNLRSATRLSHGRQDYQPEFFAGFRVARNYRSPQ